MEPLRYYTQIRNFQGFVLLENENKDQNDIITL